jgi:hypothetical protein
MFTSRGQLSARWLPLVDRLPDIPRGVDRAMWGGRPTALVGLIRQRPAVRRLLAAAGLADLEPHDVGTTYFWVEQPTRRVTALQFRLHDRGAEREVH